MLVKILLFKVTPVYAKFDETGLCSGVENAPEFIFYPNEPFDIKKTEEDLNKLYDSILPKAKS